MTDSTTARSGDFRQDMDRLGKGVDTLKQDVGSVAHGAADAARSGAEELRAGMHDGVKAAKDKLADLKVAAGEDYDAAKQAALDAAGSMKEVIARNPVATIGIALGVGIAIGFLLRRPRS